MSATIGHVMILAKEPGEGIENWRDTTAKLSKLPHVVSAQPDLFNVWRKYCVHPGEPAGLALQEVHAR